MPLKPLDDLGELQRAVLNALWDLGPSSVQDVLDKASLDRPLAYTTILSTLQNLEKAGWVSHQREGRAHIYTPTRTRAQAGATSLRSFIKRTFAGDPALLLQTLIEHETLGKQDLARLRAMIDARKKETKHE